jgi:peptidoglycan/xylan/chitin deacetylase (PgdA/CDA1 family)
MKHTLKRAALRALGRFASHVRAQDGAILCFHSLRVEADSGDRCYRLRDLSVSPSFLEALIVDLRRCGFDLVPLSEAVARLRGGPGGRFVAVTFDDGWADTFTTALPILVRHAVPFTVFLTSGFIDRTVPMWWVAFETILRELDNLILPGQAAPDHAATDKSAAFTAADDLVRRLPRSSLPAFFAQLFELNSEALALGPTLAAPLDWVQARAMASTGLVTFGCHTVSHPVLARLDAASCKAEIVEGRRRVAEELGVTPQFFAYPYGGNDEIGVDAPRIVAECGFEAAFTTSRRLLRTRLAGPAAYLLPRFVPETEDLLLSRAYISGLPWALRDAQRGRMRTSAA